MGIALILIEGLAVGLLLVAVLVACISRLERPKLRLVLSMLISLPYLLMYLVFAGVLIFFRSENILDGGLLVPVVFLTILYATGAVWIIRKAFRRREDGTVDGTSWPRARLALTLFIAVALNAMTTWNLDLAVRQRLADLQTEATAIALSLAPARIPDRDNAAWIYLQAFETFDSDSWTKERKEQWDRWTDFDSDEFDPNDPALKKFLGEYAPTMRLLHKAASKPGCHFEHDYTRGFELTCPEIASSMNAGRLLALNARSCVARGDVKTAIQDVRTMFRIAEHTGSGFMLITALVAVAVEANAVDTLRTILATGQPTADQLKSVDLDGIQSFQRLFSRAFRLEEAFAMTVFEQLCYSKPEWWADLSGGGNYPPALAKIWYRIYLAESDVASYREAMSKLVRISAGPYHEAEKEIGKYEEEFESKPKGLVTSMMMPALSHAIRRAAEGDATHRTASIALAAARFRAEKGELPGALEKLVPEYIPVIPRDPFDGKPMKYLKTDKGAVIYSIGPDKKDEKGADWDKKNKKGDIVFKLNK